MSKREYRSSKVTQGRMATGVHALVCEEIARAGGIGREFNTIAVDDGIAMGHLGMLYSLPSRDLIAGSIEYMFNAHCADPLIKA